MCNETIKLWTIHSPDFELTSGEVDHNRSEYYQETIGVKEAYHRLWELLGIPDGQVIWCYTKNDGIIKRTTKKIMWELEVPLSEIMCFIDELVWNRILGIRCHVSKTMQYQWKKEAMNQFPNDADAQHSYINQRKETFWRQEPKFGSWWDELFVPEPEECASAIIHHPIPEKFVKNKKDWVLSSDGISD